MSKNNSAQKGYILILSLFVMLGLMLVGLLLITILNARTDQMHLIAERGQKHHSEQAAWRWASQYIAQEARCFNNITLDFKYQVQLSCQPQEGGFEVTIDQMKLNDWIMAAEQPKQILKSGR